MDSSEKKVHDYLHGYSSGLSAHADSEWSDSYDQGFEDGRTKRKECLAEAKRKIEKDVRMTERFEKVDTEGMEP